MPNTVIENISNGYTVLRNALTIAFSRLTSRQKQLEKEFLETLDARYRQFLQAMGRDGSQENTLDMIYDNQERLQNLIKFHLIEIRELVHFFAIAASNAVHTTTTENGIREFATEMGRASTSYMTHLENSAGLRRHEQAAQPQAHPINAQTALLPSTSDSSIFTDFGSTHRRTGLDALFYNLNWQAGFNAGLHRGRYSWWMGQGYGSGYVTAEAARGVEDAAVYLAHAVQPAASAAAHAASHAASGAGHVIGHAAHAVAHGVAHAGRDVGNCCTGCERDGEHILGIIGGAVAACVDGIYNAIKHCCCHEAPAAAPTPPGPNGAHVLAHTAAHGVATTGGLLLAKRILQLTYFSLVSLNLINRAKEMYGHWQYDRATGRLTADIMAAVTGAVIGSVTVNINALAALSVGGPVTAFGLATVLPFLMDNLIVWRKEKSAFNHIGNANPAYVLTDARLTQLTQHIVDPYESIKMRFKLARLLSAIGDMLDETKKHPENKESRCARFWKRAAYHLGMPAFGTTLQQRLESMLDAMQNGNNDLEALTRNLRALGITNVASENLDVDTDVVDAFNALSDIEAAVPEYNARA